jgi:MFS family permease
MTSRSHVPGLWPLLALNFFMADMQSGVGPFVGVFLQDLGWDSGLIGTAMTIGNVAGMLITTPIGGFINSSRNKRMWVVIPGICVVAASAIILISQNFWAVTASQIAQSLASVAIVPAVTINLGQGAVITVQGVGASLSPALGGWIAEWIGYGPTFLLLGGFGLASTALWFAFGAAVKKY